MQTLVLEAGARRVAYGAAHEHGVVQMINRWLKGVAIGALICAGAVAAQAADLPTTKGPPPTPVFVPPPFTWTGFYVGLNAGGIISSGSRNVTLVDPYTGDFLTSSFPGGIGNGKSGFIGGGQAGYDWQSGAFVFGVVTDFDGTTLNRNFNFTSTPYGVPGPFFNDTLNVNAKANLDWLGTTRGKIGFVVTPDNRLMIYGTGGVAYGGGSSNFNIFDSNNGLFWSGNPSSTRVGWTVGAGVEYAFTNNWEIGAEYLYADLGSNHITATPNSAASFFFPNVYATAKIDYNASIFRAFVNYKF
jgi:outer membrane immunogenic protein